MTQPASERRSFTGPELTVTGGDGDAERTGHWTVTGPQDPRDVYAIVERSKSPEDGHVFYAWYLYQRTLSEYGRTTYMRTIGQGSAATLEASMGDLSNAWGQLLGVE